MVRAGTVVCLLLCFVITVHVVLSPRAQCLASLDIGMDPVEAMDLTHVNNPRVPVYFSLVFRRD